MTGVYIIKSVKNSRYYIGSTIDIDRRLKEHNSGKVFSTKGNIPWELKIFLNCDNILKYFKVMEATIGHPPL